MEGERDRERFYSSRWRGENSPNPRTQLGPEGFMVASDRGSSSNNSSKEMMHPPPPPVSSTTPVLDRFRAVLKEREDQLLIGGGGGGGGSDFEDEDYSSAFSLNNNNNSDEIVRVYQVVLSELTFNSKPIITDLTIIAGEQRDYAAQGIAHAICDRIIQAQVEQKLPSLYLLDSIVKNIGCEYVTYFTARLPEVFVEAYRQVHPDQHPAMRHLFRTWSAVFPSSVLRKIGNELQFSFLANHHQSSGSTSLRSSESHSARPTHVIHVNPKYLEARRQYEHATVIKEAPDARGISSSLQRYCHKPVIGHGEYDVDNTEINIQHAGSQRLGSPDIASCASIAGAEKPVSQNYENSRPSSPRVRLPECLSASDDGYMIDYSRSKAAERASPSHCRFDYAPGRLRKRDGKWSDRWLKHPVEDICTPVEMNLKSEFDRQRPRALIDAYGNHRRESFLNGKPPMMEGLDVNGIKSEATTKRWQNTEEEEYVWEDMSPTLADRSRGNDLMPPNPHLGNTATRAGFGRPTASKPDYRAGIWPAQHQLTVTDDTPNIFGDGGLILGNGFGDIGRKYMDGVGNRINPLQLQRSNYSRDNLNVHPHSSQPQLYPEASGNADYNSLLSVGTGPSAGQRGPSLMNNTDVLSSMSPASVVEKHFEQRFRPPSMASQRWSQMNSPSLPILPQENQIKGQFDFLDANKPLRSHVVNEASVLPQQHFDSFERKAGNSNKLLPLSSFLPGSSYLNSQSQGPVNPLQSQVLKSMAPGNFITPISAQVLPPLVPRPLNHGHFLQGNGALTGTLPLNRLSGVPSSLLMYGTPNTSFQLQGGTKPPLPPGPPPSLQMGSSQIVGPVACNSSAAIEYADLFSNLMAHGMIKLTTPMSGQDSVGVEFNADILKVRHESSIKALYADLPRQCKTCGLRFKSQEEHSAHMDWHVAKNRVCKNRKQKPSRKWFVSTSLWLSGAETVGTDALPGFLPNESVIEKKDDEVIAVPADENQSACALCGEPFDDFYSDEAEEWMYKGAMYLNAPNGSTIGMDRSQLGPIVHAKCRSESTAVACHDDCGLKGREKDEDGGNQPKRMRF